MLSQQRAALGDEEFERVLGTLLDNESVGLLMEVTANTD
jgi:hypothetical protein